MVGNQSCSRDADKGVESVPYEIEAWDLVGDELCREEDGADDEDPGVAEGVQAGGELDPLCAGEQTEGKDGGVDIQTRRKAPCDNERDDVGGAEAHRGLILPFGELRALEARRRMVGTGWSDVQEWAIGRMNDLAVRAVRSRETAPHLLLGLRGERAGLFELRRRGYTVVARRWRSPKLRGDLDLVAWDGNWLCFVEVKTRSERRLATPAETSVDEEKRRMLRRMARAYLGQFPEERRGEVAVRFDVMAVYLGEREREFELFRGAFGWR